MSCQRYMYLCKFYNCNLVICFHFTDQSTYGYQWEGVVNEKYPHVVYEERCKGYDAEQSETTTVEDDGSDELEGLFPFSFVLCNHSTHRFKRNESSLVCIMKRFQFNYMSLLLVLLAFVM